MNTTIPTVQIPKPRAGRLSARLVATTLAAALTGSVLAFAPAATAADAVNVPTEEGAQWLQGELTGGLIHNEAFDFDDLGLSIDVGLGLIAAGGQDPAVGDIDTAMQANINSYIAGDAFGDVGSTYAGATGKAAAFAYAAGATPTSYGGVNLISRLEGVTSSTAPIAGRLEDTSSFGDYANSIGQGFAVEALTKAGSSEAPAATEFLLKQQCSDGFFRLNFTVDKTAADQTCDSGTADESAPDTDVTALVVLSLLRSDSQEAAVTTAIDDANAWLLSTQKANGSWGGGPSTEAANTNSTGLAGWALGLAGETEAAADAAVYVRTLQAFYSSPCVTNLTSEGGAIAYDAAGLAAGIADGITAESSDQWRRATAQALPVLAYAPTNAAAPKVVTPAGYVAAKSNVKVKVTGLELGERVCLVNYLTDEGKSFLATSSTTEFAVKAPKKTRNFRAGVLAFDGYNSGVIKVLGKQTLKVKLDKASVKKGKKQSVVVKDLAAGERVKIKFHGKVVAKGKAGPGGKFKAKFKVKGARGPAKVIVKGQFPNREGSARFVVR